MKAPERIALFLFTVDPAMAREAVAAGIEALVVDWEWRGKSERQRGADTEINRHTPEELAALRPFGIRRCCRINAFGADTVREVELAVENGATDVLLPMVRAVSEAETLLRLLDGRARAGILVETMEACDRAGDLGRLPLDLVYLGLNDLALERGSSSIFEPLLDGTAERLREAFSGTAFGLGGLTLVEKGSPVPCLRLLEEMARLGCDFTFLRRSFKRDVRGRSMATELGRLREAWDALRHRGAAEIEAAHDRLCQGLAQPVSP